MWKLLPALLLFAVPALAQENPSAYEALRVIGTQLNRDLVTRVISVTGTDGDPQPRTWKILVVDRRAQNRVREIVVEGEQILSQRDPNRSVAGSTEGATINTSRLNLDSTGAYTVASHTAETSHVTFTFVSYTLRTDERGNPVWIVTLEDRSRKPLGSIHIKANDGRVTRVEGMYQGRNMDQVEDERDKVQKSDTDESEDADENVVKRKIKKLFFKTRDDARRMFERVRRSFSDFFNRR
ncbi:MAG: hypothetical protein QOD12_1570 [Verrucomicrobiota bacterium]|jgi:hypothetical protein